jgi:intracellular sulfur oxidation DsrE/DsrF family protein
LPDQEQLREDAMHRRGLLWGAVSAIGAVFAASQARANTMKSQNISLNDLLPGFVTAGRGGVVRLAELQSQGYLYLRP